MRLNKRLLHQQRKRLDSTLESWLGISKTTRPRAGWLRAIRESLGLSTQQLAKRMGLKNAASAFRLEERELDGTVSLKTLQDAAQAMGCQLVYAIIPTDESLEALLDRRAKETASKIVSRVTHTMNLENQSVDLKSTHLQIEELAAELKQKFDPRLWD